MKRHLRYAVSLLFAFVSWRLMPGTTVWLLFFLLAAFFIARDIFSLGKGTRPLEPRPVFNEENERTEEGVIGTYVVDSDQSVGLFMVLLGQRVFVDLREDQLLDARKERALLLFSEKQRLEDSLEKFLESNPTFLQRRLTYIGLHYPEIDQAAVFWEPDGHTTLRDLEFFLPT